MQTTHMATPVLEVAHLEKVYGALGNVTAQRRQLYRQPR